MLCGTPPDDLLDVAVFTMYFWHWDILPAPGGTLTDPGCHPGLFFWPSAIPYYLADAIHQETSNQDFFQESKSEIQYKQN
jgi:hypothetical protein